MRRLLRPLIGIAIAAALLVALFLLVLGPRRVVSGSRTPLLRTPAEIGVESWEEVEFSPPDQDIILRAWWMPAAATGSWLRVGCANQRLDKPDG